MGNFDGLVAYKGGFLQDKTVVLILAAEWHIYFRNTLLPKLENIYTAVRGPPHNAEFIYVSMDRTREEFNRFTSKMKWHVLAYDDPLRTQLIQVCLPPNHQPSQCLIMSLLNKRILCRNAVSRLSSEADDGIKSFPWEGSAAENGCAIAAACLMCSIQ